MSTSGRKTVILEHWFGIDRVLFGGDAKDYLSEDSLNMYCASKGAFLTNLYEIYLKLGYDPDIKFKNTKEMSESSQVLAEQALESANKIMMKENVGTIVKKEIQEAGHLEGLEESEIARYIIKKRRNAIAIDAMTVGSLIKENASKIDKDDWQSKVLLDAHKTIRDSLIDISLE
jgi:putative cell wall-binding protein